jgi:DNA-binding MarR family transcriptional regulator
LDLDFEEIARLSGLGRRDALILGALEHTPENPKKHRWLARVFMLRRYRVRSALSRLEQRGFVEPGWTVDAEGGHYAVTDAGRRVARALHRAVGVEDYPGELRRIRGRR